MSLTSVDRNIANDILNHLEASIDVFPALQKIRRQAYETLRGAGLPGNKHEEYKFTPLGKALDKFDFTLKQTSESSLEAVNDFFIPGTDAYTIIFINGVYKPELSSAIHTKGLTVKLLTEVVENSPEIIQQYIASFSEAIQDPFTAWNIAGWDNGLFISVDNNVIVDKPIAFYNIIDSRTNQVINVNRNLVVVGKNSELSIIQKINSIGDQPNFINTVTECIVSEKAGLNHYSVQNDSGDHYQFNRTHILQSNASRVNSYSLALDGKLIRNNLQLSLNGEGCESHMYGLYLLKGNTLVDNHTVADHQKPNSFSNELYKGIMDDQSKGVFNGKIYVRPDAQKTNAFQSNRNILLSDSAKVNTKPQLEIWADDVKCSHGCTTGQLDEDALFYLQTRGISKKNAQAMLLYAFAGEVIATVNIPAVKEYMEKIISARLHQTR